jgi:hypothetical protein
MRASRLGQWRLGPGGVVTGLVAVAVFWVAYDNGSYSLESRNTLAIALWWALIVVVLFGLFPREPTSRVSLVIGGLLAALALWTLASLLWSPSAEKTFDEFNRVTLYFGAFALVTVGVSRRNIGRWADGLAVAIAAVAAVALTSRLFPGSFPEGDLPTFLPGTVTRLSFPLGYWNGLAIFLALGVPLLLRIAVIARSAAVRGLALAPIPVIATVIFLTSSRGGSAAALVGSIVFLALTDRRWTAAAALVTSSLGGAAAIIVLLRRNELVDGPLGTGLVERQGRSAALLIALICLAVGVVYGFACHLLGGRIRPGRTTGRVVALAAVVATVVGIAAADPMERLDTFRTPPQELSGFESGDFVKQHLLSGSGSGRWQFWTSALDEWREYPVLGEGAGAYEAWWAEHGSISLFAKDAHSLYLETLGELGVLGLLLVVTLVVTGVGVGVRRVRSATGDQRVTVSALVAVFLGYAAAAGIDWVWELTAVGVLAFVALALVSGSSAAAPASLSAVEPNTRPLRVRGHFGLGVAALLVAWILILGQAIPLLAQGEIADSQAAVRRGDLGEAFSAAGGARDIQPWAATPYLQLALVSEDAGDLRRARAWIDDAIERDARDWRLWLVSARIETKLGRVGAAERSLQRAISLNPRSPLFNERLGEGGSG